MPEEDEQDIAPVMPGVGQGNGLAVYGFQGYIGGQIANL